MSALILFLARWWFSGMLKNLARPCLWWRWKETSPWAAPQRRTWPSLLPCLSVGWRSVRSTPWPWKKSRSKVSAPLLLPLKSFLLIINWLTSQLFFNPLQKTPRSSASRKESSSCSLKTTISLRTTAGLRAKTIARNKPGPSPSMPSQSCQRSANPPTRSWYGAANQIRINVNQRTIDQILEKKKKAWEISDMKHFYDITTHMKTYLSIYV